MIENDSKKIKQQCKKIDNNTNLTDPQKKIQKLDIWRINNTKIVGLSRLKSKNPVLIKPAINPAVNPSVATF